MRTRVEYCMISDITSEVGGGGGQMLSRFRSVAVEGDGWLGSGRKVDSKIHHRMLQ